MNEQLNEIVRLFLACADKTRLQLLYLLRDGEVSVNALADALKTSQPKVSRHLAYLRTMNMVTTRRQGKSIYYKLDLPADTFGASVIEETIAWLDGLAGSSNDPKRPKAGTQRAISTQYTQPLSENTGPNPAEEFVEPEPEHSEPEMEVYLL